MEQININGKKFPLSLKLGAMRKYCMRHKIKLHELLDSFKNIDLKNIDFEDLDILGEVTLCGIEEGLRKNGKPTDHGLVLENFYDLLEDDPDAFGAVIEAIGDNEPEATEEESTDPNASSLEENQ